MARNAKAIQTKSKTHSVSHINGSQYRVVSGSTGSEYTVFYSKRNEVVTGCTCEWAQYRKAGSNCSCSHVVAVAQFVEQAAVSTWATKEDAERQHRSTVDLGDGMFATVRRS
jgi:hypothetical protein